MTRQNAVVSQDGSAMVQALIPLWDMCNHTDGKLSTDFNVELDRSECLAWRPVPKGSQVLIYYGSRPNCDLLIHNGFVLPGSPGDVVQLRLGVARADPLHADKVALLHRLGLPAAGDWELCSGPQPVSPRLAAFLRIFNMDKDNLDQWTSSSNVESLFEEDCALDAGLQERVWNFLAMRIRLLLAAYPTKKEDDESLLADTASNLSPCSRLGVMLRLEEKRLLEAVVAFAEKKRCT